MLAQSNVLMACKHYPHTDFPERAAEAFSILCRAASSEIAPVMAAVRVPAFGLYPTTEPPFDALVDDLQSAERQPGVLSASALHGFTGGDCPWLAAAIVVVADGDQARAQWVAMGLANGFLRRIETAPPIGLPIDDALTAAAAVSAGAPVVMSDGADNAGGGAAADSTVVLQALLDSALPLRPAAVALMWDPVTVELAHRAGLGARLAMRIGGKTGPMSGVPLDLDVEVTALAQDAMQTTFSSVPDQPLGRSVALRVGTWPASVDIVVNTERQQVFSPHVFTAHGLDPMAYRLLVVKSTQHFYAAFAPFAAAVVRCEAPGTMSEDARQLPYRHRPQPMRPWDPDAVCTPFWP
jgi:microcystin degradation protein MlrC